MNRFIIQRYIKKGIENDALQDNKMAFISGPRQIGKTTLCRLFLQEKQNEFNWDDWNFRKEWTKNQRQSIRRHGKGPVLLDEIHKDRRWKSRLKGLYDLHSDSIQFIITASARLDLYQKMSHPT